MMLKLILITLLFGHLINAYNILIWYPTPSISHQLPAMALTEALIKRGHKLFVISPNVVPGLEKNYTFIDVSFTYKFVTDEEAKDSETISTKRRFPKWAMVDMFKPYAGMIIKQFKSEAFLSFQKRVAAEKISFDVSIAESIFAPHGCAMTRYLAGHGTPFITLSTTLYSFYGEDDLGSPLHLSYLPSFTDSYSDKMNLWQKIDNWIAHHYLITRLKNIVEDSARTYFRDTHGVESEKLVDGCWSNASLELISSNSLYYYPRLLGPNVVELGPLHIKPPQKLPQNLQDWLDGAEKGVIYFSLGSNMKSKNLPEDVRSNFLNFFRNELPPGYRVLWKWELDGKIPGQSDNILAQKWLPQQSVLAHPKVKAFITQCGLQSFQETVHYGVPTIGVPAFGDQDANAAKMEKAEIGVALRPQDLHSYEKIKSALEAVLYDSRYARNMRKLSEISRDFTDQALNNAVFWIEHVAKHRSAAHLRPSTADTTYFQFFCLDILSVIVAISLIILYVIISIFKCIRSSIFSSPITKEKKS